MVSRWLHELLFEDWSLKLLALLITMGLWYAVTGQRAPATIRLRGVRLEFLQPNNIEISNDVIEEVSLTLEGSQGKLAELDTRNLVARADITQLKPGDRVARLTPQNVTMELPTDVRITAIEPRSVALRLEPVVEREVEVEAHFEGALPPGYMRRGVQIIPERVRLRGPESHVNAIEKAPTETISLEGQAESLTLPQIAIDVHDRKVVPLDALVTVRVEIIEERIEKQFSNVPVRSATGGQPHPASVSVRLQGPRSVMEKLRPEDVRIIIEEGAEGAVRPRLSLPPDAEGRVELVSTTPSEFLVNR